MTMTKWLRMMDAVGLIGVSLPRWMTLWHLPFWNKRWIPVVAVATITILSILSLAQLLVSLDGPLFHVYAKYLQRVHLSSLIRGLASSPKALSGSHCTWSFWEST